MQIVIEIPKSVIEHIKDGSFGARIEDRAALIDAVMSGTPLPEHHGRLIDADALIYSLGISDEDIYCKGVIEEEAPTIIEAEESERR